MSRTPIERMIDEACGAPAPSKDETRTMLVNFAAHVAQMTGEFLSEFWQVEDDGKIALGIIAARDYSAFAVAHLKDEPSNPAPRGVDEGGERV